MNDLEPWKIWALTAVLVAAILETTSAKLQPVAGDSRTTPAEAPDRTSEPTASEPTSAYASYETSAPGPSVRYYSTAPTPAPSVRTNVSVNIVDTVDVSDVPDDNLVAITSNLDNASPAVLDAPQHIWNYNGQVALDFQIDTTNDSELTNFDADLLISNSSDVTSLAWQDLNDTVSDVSKALVDEIMPADYANTVDGRIDAAVINYEVGRRLVEQINTNTAVALDGVPASVQLGTVSNEELTQEARVHVLSKVLVQAAQLTELDIPVSINYTAPLARQNSNAQPEIIDLYDGPVENL